MKIIDLTDNEEDFDILLYQSPPLLEDPSPNQHLQLTPVDDTACDYFDMQNWLGHLRSGAVISSDGIGFYATSTHETDLPVNFNKSGDGVPEWATHVCWYNK